MSSLSFLAFLTTRSFLTVLIVPLVPSIPIVLVFYLVFEVSIIAGAGVTRVVLLFPGIPVDAVPFAIGFPCFEPRLLLRHAAIGNASDPAIMAADTIARSFFIFP